MYVPLLEWCKCETFMQLVTECLRMLHVHATKIVGGCVGGWIYPLHHGAKSKYITN